MNLSQYRSLAVNRLNYDGRDVHDGILEFMAVLCVIEDELLEFEVEVSKQEVDWVGLDSTQELRDLESRHSEFIEEIQSAYEAIRLGHLTRLERNPGEKYAEPAQYQVPEFRDEFLLMMTRLEDISERIGRRIDAKRSSANTRLVLSVAVVAAMISVLTLLGQIIGVVVQM